MRKLLPAVAFVVVLAVACGGTDEAEPATTQAPAATEAPAPTEAAAPVGVEVSIQSFSFGPDEITVAAGTTVTWVNDEDAVPHTATSEDGVWDSGTLQPGDSFSFTFDVPGTYPYFCAIHPSMTATIVVEG